MKKLLGIAFFGMMAIGCGGGSNAPAPATPATPPPAAADPNAAQTPPAADAPAQNTAPPNQ